MLSYKFSNQNTLQPSHLTYSLLFDQVLGINSQTSARSDAGTASCTKRWAECVKKIRLCNSAKLKTEHVQTDFYYGATASSGPGPPHYRGFTITLRHTTLGRNPLYE